MTYPSCHRKGSTPRWNITIVVLLLMVASGLLALLTLQFVKHFLSSGTILEHYYKAYYMARGGLETLLTESNLRGYGYEQDLSKSSIATNYYNDCADKSLCQLHGRIISHGAGISDSPVSLSSSSCEPADMILLTPGESSAYPLFYDRGKGDNISFAPVQTSDYEKLWNFGFDITLSWGSLETYLYDAGQGTFGQISDTQIVSAPSASNVFSQKSLVHTHRLILSNPQSATSAVSYCLKSDDAAQLLVGNYTNINSQATYGDKTVGVTALKKFVFPSAFIQ